MDKLPMRISLLIIVAAGLIAVPTAAMINPAAGYCTALGYNYTENTGSDGSMTGYCTLSGNQTVDAWQFLYGNVSADKSYCTVHGMQIQTVENVSVCGMIGSRCGACVEADGSVKEVTAAMGLDFREKICSGSICCDPAKDTTCPIGQEQQADWTLPLLAVIVIVLVLLGAALIFIQKKKAKPQEEKKS
jgi:putative hemolysin